MSLTTEEQIKFRFLLIPCCWEDKPLSSFNYFYGQSYWNTVKYLSNRIVFFSGGRKPCRFSDLEPSSLWSLSLIHLTCQIITGFLMIRGPYALVPDHHTHVRGWFSRFKYLILLNYVTWAQHHTSFEFYYHCRFFNSPWSTLSVNQHTTSLLGAIKKEKPTITQNKEIS